MFTRLSNGKINKKDNCFFNQSKKRTSICEINPPQNKKDVSNFMKNNGCYEKVNKSKQKTKYY